MAATKEEIVDLLRENAEELCRELLPGGKRNGPEWQCGSIEGEPGKSMSVRLTGPKTGIWKDFASDQGGDILALVQAAKGIADFKQLLDWCRSWLNLPAWQPQPGQQAAFNPLKYAWKGMYGDIAYPYKDAEGSLIGYVVRGGEAFGKGMPLRLIGGEWRWKGWTGEEQKPIFGLELLARRPKAPLLIVEGEKTTMAARRLFPDRVVLSWQSGSGAVKKVDWGPVIEHIRNNIGSPDFNTVLWPDADTPGAKAMRYLHTLLPDAKLVDVSQLDEGWDLADTPPEGLDLDAMVHAAILEVRQPKIKKEKKPKPEEVLLAPEQPLQGDIPMPDLMELPDGVEWNDVRAHAVNYNLFFHRHRLFSKRVELNKYGEILRQWWHPITNFSIQILQFLEDEKESMYLLRIVNVDNRKRTFHTGTDMLLTSGNFKKTLLGKGDYRYTGNEREADFERLVTLLLTNMGDGQKVDVLGWQHDSRVYAMNNMLITAKGKLIGYDEFGSTEIDGKHYYVPSANKIFAKNPYRYLPQKRFKFVDSGIQFKELAAQLVKVHRDHGMIGLVFAVACVFSSAIFDYHDFFPMTFLYGEPSTGKSHLSKVIQHFFGDRQEAMQVTGKSTDKAKIRKFAQFVDGLVVLEEFSNSIGDNGFQWLKGLNDRHGYERGTIESNFGTDNVPITSGVILTGNDYPQNDALLTRLVVIEMLKNKFSDKEREEFGKLTDMMEKGYSSIIAELMRYREQFEVEYKQCYHDAQATMTQVLTLQGVTLERMVQNPSILLAVYMFFQNRIEWPMTIEDFTGALVKAMVSQNDKRDTGGDVAKWWACIQAAIKAEKLVPGEDFKVDGDRLYLRFSDCHEQYSIFHRTIYFAPGHVSATMKTKLEKNPAFLERVNNTRFKNVVTSAYVFSLKAIGDEFTHSITMKRLSKYGRRNDDGPPDGPDGGNSPTPVSPVVQPELSYEDAPF